MPALRLAGLPRQSDRCGLRGGTLRATLQTDR